MIDLRWTELTPGLSLLFLLSFFLFVASFIGKCVWQPKWQQSKVNWWQFIFSLFLIIVVCSSNHSDWFSYQIMVWNYDFTVGAINHGEPVYAYIVKFVHKNYLLFRIVVWGGAFSLSYIVFNRFGTNVNVAAFLLVTVFLLKFNYARASLAMVCYFSGCSFLFKPTKRLKIMSFSLAVLFFWLAYEFHYSMLPILFLTLIAFVPIKKVPLLILIVLLPFIASFISNHFGVLDEMGNDYYSFRMESLSKKTAEAANILGVISNIFSYGSFLIPALFITIAINKYHDVIELSMLRLYRIMIGIFLFAFSFMFMGFQSVFFLYRYLYVTFIPIATLSAYLYEKELLNRWKFSFIIIIGIVANSISLAAGVFHTL